jgi:hypothetical protein
MEKMDFSKVDVAKLSAAELAVLLEKAKEGEKLEASYKKNEAIELHSDITTKIELSSYHKALDCKNVLNLLFSGSPDTYLEAAILELVNMTSYSDKRSSFKDFIQNLIVHGIDISHAQSLEDLKEAAKRLITPSFERDSVKFDTSDNRKYELNLRPQIVKAKKKKTKEAEAKEETVKI